jgi:radical SAM protein with 4Fe4S-binding SPASM domain
MELIIKPTEACNFKCTFCSSTDIAYDKKATLDLQYIYDFLKRFPETNTIIINGGDPLMMPPEYYWEIIKHLDEIGSKCTLSFTSNLWAFYKKPEMWEDLFLHPRVGVTTSFNYGETRRVTHSQNYTEDLFWEVSNMFLEKIGYRPDFISVINEENEDTAIDNVLLAKRMGVECKLNYAMASGIQGKPYQLSKIYKTYVEIYKLGLWEWEYNTKQMMIRLSGRSNSCPQNRNCDEGIRAMNPEGDYYSCGSTGDDRMYPINFVKEVKEFGVKELPLKTATELQALKMDCYTCNLFQICNGCRKTIRDMKSHAMVSKHCTLMKTLEQDILNITEKNVSTSIDLNKKTNYEPLRNSTI